MNDDLETVDVDLDASDGLFHPHQSKDEWARMWALGLSRKQIAERCGIELEVVSGWISYAAKREPGLRHLHDRNSPPRIAPQPQSERTFDGKLDELCAWIDEHGRFPRSIQGPGTVALRQEDRLDAWLGRLRRMWLRGELSELRTAKLDATIPDWTQSGRERRAEESFMRWLSDVADFVAASGRLPAASATRPAPEARLGRWISDQRRRVQEGAMTVQQARELESVCPDWYSHRPRNGGESR